jgi:DNA-binding transcriptional MerR regulator
MQMKEASERSGLSADTIRFYEKSGMLRRRLLCQQHPTPI